MKKWDKLIAELWVNVTPEEVQFTTLFDEIAFTDQGITYRSHTLDHSGPLAKLYDELYRRYDRLSLMPREASDLILEEG